MSTAELRAAATIAELSSLPPHRLYAARAVKNAVVGNPTNKRLYLRLGVIQPLLLAAADVAVDPRLAEQAVAALGSLAALLDPPLVQQVTPVLLAALHAADARAVHAAARALKMLVVAEGADEVSLGLCIATPRVAERFVALVAGAEDGVAEVCAVVVARTCVGHEQARVYERAGVVTALVYLLCRTNHERCIEACLHAMAALARHVEGVAQVLVGGHGIVEWVLPLTRSARDSLRLAACRVLTIFHAAGQLAVGLDAVVSTALVGLLESEDVQSQICTALTLEQLVAGQEELQRVATEADAIGKLAEVIRAPLEVAEKMEMEMEVPVGTGSGPLVAEISEMQRPVQERAVLQAAALTALAALCGDFDEAREKVVNLQVLPYIVEALSSRSNEIVLAAVKCIRALSRSVKVLRRDIAQESVGKVLLQLLSLDNEPIRRAVSGTLCNLVLEFSPVRAVILDGGGTDVFVKLLKGGDEEMKKNALWALKNLLFQADSETKSAVMAKMGYDELQALCGDQNPRVREIAMRVVRNLACSGTTEPQSDQLDALFAAMGNRLITMLSDALRADEDDPELAVQALYVVCNVASGTEEHKASLMGSDIPQLILRWTSHEDERARIVAVWCATNLSWKGGPVPARRSTRVMRRSQRAAMRQSSSRLERLRRQHLPAPSSPLSWRQLEEADTLDHQSADSSLANSATDSPSNEEMNDAEPNVVAERSSEERDSSSRDATMSVAEEQQQTPKSSGYEWRIGRLRELGFEGRLRSLVNDPHVEVQGRAREALKLFDCSESNSLEVDQPALFDYNPSLMARQSQSPRSSSILLRVAESDNSSGGSSA